MSWTQRLTSERREMLTVSQSETHLDVRYQWFSLSEKSKELQERLEQLRQVDQELQAQRTQFEERRNQTFRSLEGERQMQLDIMKDVDSFQGV